MDKGWRHIRALVFTGYSICNHACLVSYLEHTETAAMPWHVSQRHHWHHTYSYVPRLHQGIECMSTDPANPTGDDLACMARRKSAASPSDLNMSRYCHCWQLWALGDVVPNIEAQDSLSARHARSAFASCMLNCTAFCVYRSVGQRHEDRTPWSSHVNRRSGMLGMRPCQPSQRIHSPSGCCVVLPESLFQTLSPAGLPLANHQRLSSPAVQVLQYHSTAWRRVGRRHAARVLSRRQAEAPDRAWRSLRNSRVSLGLGDRVQRRTESQAPMLPFALHPFYRRLFGSRGNRTSSSVT